MRHALTLLIVALPASLLVSCSGQPSPTYDLVIANGRVMDPESGVDAVRHVGISGSTIAAISETPLAGTRVIDAANLVVAPGFIDLHEHGQQEDSYRMMVRDGVTSAFELEVGTGDVAALVRRAEGGADRELRRRDRPHSRAHEGPRRSGHRPSAGGYRRIGNGHGSADAGDGSHPARGAGAGRGRHGLWQRLHARRADLGDRAHVQNRRRRRRERAHPHARRRARPARDHRGRGRRTRAAAHRARQLVRRRRSRSVPHASSTPRATPGRT